MTIQNHRREGPIPSVGDVFAWMGTHIIVRRVNPRKTRASIVVRPSVGACWSKQQPLPLPADARPCEHPTDERCDCAQIPDTGFEET